MTTQLFAGLGKDGSASEGLLWPVTQQLLAGMCPCLPCTAKLPTQQRAAVCTVSYELVERTKHLTFSHWLNQSLSHNKSAHGLGRGL